MTGDDRQRNPFDDLLRLTEEAEKEQRLLRNAHDEIAALRGEGESAGGKIRARADAQGRLIDVRFDPRAMKLGSQDLAAEVTLAVQRAQDDVAAQRDRVFRETVGAGPPDPEKVLEQFEDTMQTFTRAMNGHEARLDELLRDMDNR
ncbi:YbaB/EbfC family DNA-binding protein [Nonomuraea deserti]|uniref:YbaB/EbfC family DNA-binding protein n=1 Tax=Nonomuraea deserti TaxID=1848322 RepID=A0A4R4U5Y7_9ACTN|nr:YbaB/EbfC family nucleoid-associated protein [Nonomuraea deserti]TDC86330.1 YbaB/EbfC family DNA-binding protein [Nonomuraea deserti]